MIIRDILARDLNQRIEEIIKVDQIDEQTVYDEITEYVATDRIKDQFRTLLKAIADYPSEPHEGIGVWVSGFFGSGKSSFAKNLGYVLSNQSVLGHSASELFKNQVKDSRINEWIDLINTSYPMDVIMFDIQSDRAQSGTGTQSISSFFYRVLLRHLGYAEDFDLAELEISLENEGKLEEFIQRYDDRYAALDKAGKGSWKERGRTSIHVWNRAGVVLHEIDSVAYPSVESFAQSLAQNHVQVTPSLLVNRSFDLAARRLPGKSIVFVVDEVGQYVAFNQERLEDLRRVVELFGSESKNRLKTHQIVSPVWVIVTAQEKLDEVTSAMGDDKKVLLSKVRDRFKFEIDLSPADIQEVATKRVLAKKPETEPKLREMFKTNEGQLNVALRLERTSRKSALLEKDFVQFYPYPPHYIELSIDIMSGIRLQPGAPKHLGGSNRTIIKQAHEMLVSPRTAFAEQLLGRLVTLDKIYELVEGNLSTEKQKDIYDIHQRFADGNEAFPFATRVAKALCLLEFVRDLPRTENNIAAFLVDNISEPAPTAEVEKALDLLKNAQFVRNTESGWKLQTAQEKNWETERRNFLEPKPKDRHEIERDTLLSIFSDPKLKTYHFRDLRNFRVGISVNSIQVGEDGQVPLSIRVADDASSFNAKLEETRSESRQENHNNELYWVFALTTEIDTLVANLFASREMVKKYNQLQAQNKITNEEASCLLSEKQEVSRLQIRIAEKMTQAAESGSGLFRGVSKDGSSLGKNFTEMVKKFLDAFVPDLYPKLELGARSLKGSEAEEILKAANLNGLSQVFYSGTQSLNLVIKDGAKYVPNISADIAREVLDYLNREFSYGNKETRTGKHLETHFSGLGYGWDMDVLRLVLAVLFRAGAIEVSSGGQRFDSYQDVRSRTPFINNPAFRNALFTPARMIDLKTLTQAVEAYEELVGSTVEVEKGAIASALKNWATKELREILPVEAEAKANDLPVLKWIAEYRSSLQSILDGSAEDCIRILAGEGATLKQARDSMQKIRVATTDKNLDLIKSARQISTLIWPVLEAHGIDGELSEHAHQLRESLSSETFYSCLDDMKIHLKPLDKAYADLYGELHQKRARGYQGALETLATRPEWAQMNKETQMALCTPLISRACSELDLSGNSPFCHKCNANVSQMESDIAALDGLKTQALIRLQELTAPQEKVERVKLASYFTNRLENEEDLEKAVEQLKAHLLKLMAEGIKIILE
jgi:hypothetical protein